MTRHSDEVSLRQMLAHAHEAVALAGGRSVAALEQDRTIGLALLQLCQIVGEAANRVSAGFRESHPEIDWRGTIDLRNRLIHGYDTVDFEILWGILNRDFPALIARLRELVAPEFQ